jgi:hypothetical protein
LTLLMCPSHAETLADVGWTKQRIIEELERTRSAPQATGTGQLSGPEGVRIVVAGGPGAWIGLVTGVGRWVTKPVMLPSDWDRLVKKYRNRVPNYLRY